MIFEDDIALPSSLDAFVPDEVYYEIERELEDWFGPDNVPCIERNEYEP